jgi:hypothetical protein
MANGHGGQRTPNNPAPVSGPGALSQRTDGGAATQPPMVASGGPYGSRQEQEAVQSGAPLQGGGGTTPPPSPGGGGSLVPLDAPTQNPGEPVTAGAPLGPGIGPEAAGIKSDEVGTAEQLRPLLYSLEKIANLPGSTPQTRSYVRKLKARLSE